MREFMKTIDQWSEEYKDKYCPYIINNSNNRNMNEKIKIRNFISIKSFFQSKEFIDIREKYQNCNIKFRIGGKIGELTYNIENEKFYDSESNQIILTPENEEKYLIRSDVEIIHIMDNISENMTLKEYIDIMKDCKAFHIFKHSIQIDDESNNFIILLFAQKEQILLDYDGYELENSSSYYEKQIIEINLEK